MGKPPMPPPERLFGPTYEGPRCGARRKYDGEPCRNPVVRGKTRCRIHGGAKGSGQLTPQGRQRQRAAVTKHGLYAAPGNPMLPDRRHGPRWSDPRLKEVRKSWRASAKVLRRLKLF